MTCENCEKLRADLADLQALFDLQHTRSIQADELWRAAHPGNEHVIPDLGRLLEWMMGEMAKGHADLAALWKSGGEAYEFIERVAKQTPERPDYWSSCGQCEHNESDAEDILELLNAAHTTPPAAEPATDKPAPGKRMMRGNPHYMHLGGAFGYHGEEHEWIEACDRCPACIPVEKRRMKGNEYYPSHDVEHDENICCPLGVPCEPVEVKP